jgi:parallel beta-helix repeat protein
MIKVLAIILAMALLLSTVGVEFIGIANADPYVPPEEPPAGYRINSDGTYVGENLQRNGDTYTLSGNVNCPIAILRDDIVLDGAGYSVQGNGASVGIWLRGRNGLTIKNLNIKNFEYGVKFAYDRYSGEMITNCTLIGNKITNNTYGMLIAASSGCYIADNYIAGNIYGVKIESSSGIFRNNRFVGNHYAIIDPGYRDNDIDISNTIDNKPVYYWVNKHDTTVPSNAGMVLLKNCTGIKVENLVLKGTGTGLRLVNTNGSTISGNKLFDNSNGIILQRATNNIISGNNVTNNKNAAITLEQSKDNRINSNSVIDNGGGISCSENDTVSNNQIIANQGDGIYTGTSNNITYNYVSSNLGHGIFIRNISGCNLLGNNITLNGGNGIHFEFGPNAMIKGNYIAENNLGIWIGAAFFNNIISNTIIENRGLGIKMEGPHHDNLIYHNNFIDNNESGIQASIAKHWVYPDLFKRLPPHVTPRPPQYSDGAANAWDDGVEGNYWSDDTAATPYFINENNQDNHPLQSPHKISIYETPTKIVSFPSSPTQPSQEQSQERIRIPITYLKIAAVCINVFLVAAIATIVAYVIVALRFYFKHKTTEKNTN